MFSCGWKGFSEILPINLSSGTYEMRTVLGYSEVVTDGNGVQTLLACQQVTIDADSNILESRKVFTLNTMWGEELAATQDPLIFKGKNGLKYKRIDLFRQERAYSYRNRIRRGDD